MAKPCPRKIFHKFFEGVCSCLMPCRSWKSPFFSPGTVAIHNESYMSELFIANDTVILAVHLSFPSFFVNTKEGIFALPIDIPTNGDQMDIMSFFFASVTASTFLMYLSVRS